MVPTEVQCTKGEGAHTLRNTNPNKTRPMVSSKWKQAGKVKMTKEVLNDEGKWN
jgi:hypothetical protein